MADQLCDSAKANRILAAMIGSLEPEDIAYVVGLMKQDDVIDDGEERAINEAANGGENTVPESMAGDSALSYDARLYAHVRQVINKRCALHRNGQMDVNHVLAPIGAPPRTAAENQAFDALFGTARVR